MLLVDDAMHNFLLGNNIHYRLHVIMALIIVNDVILHSCLASWTRG
jgi:hypothetical protein